MKGTLLNLLCVIIICATGALCVLIHSEYNRYRFSGTPRAGAVYKLDKRTGNVWWIVRSKAALVEDPTKLLQREIKRGKDTGGIPDDKGIIWDDEKPKPIDQDKMVFTDEPTK